LNFLLETQAVKSGTDIAITANALRFFMVSPGVGDLANLKSRS
jgi:hypothetical protein